MNYVTRSLDRIMTAFIKVFFLFNLHLIKNLPSNLNWVYHRVWILGRVISYSEVQAMWDICF